MNDASRILRVPLIIFSLASVIFAAGYFLRSVPRASAAPDGPEVTGGSHPYRSFSGTIPKQSDGAQTIFTVPNDRVFILTGACMTLTNVDILENETLKVSGSVHTAFCGGAGFSPTSNFPSTLLHTGFLANGQGKIPFAPGTQLKLKANNSSGYVEYYALQGYLAHP